MQVLKQNNNQFFLLWILCSICNLVGLSGHIIDTVCISQLMIEIACTFRTIKLSFFSITSSNIV